LRRFKDKHIVHLIASETSQNSGKREAYLLLEYCSGGHLLAKLNGRNGVPLPLSDICRIFSQLLEAVAPLHSSSPPVIHRDLKLENILFSEEGFVKLCDFGSCALGYTPLRTAEERSRAEESISKETTQMYRAPEMVDLYMRDELTEKTDIWVKLFLVNINLFRRWGAFSIVSVLSRTLFKMLEILVS
jgi:AP2-associated kinase